jgi:hypothetical protein
MVLLRIHRTMELLCFMGPSPITRHDSYATVDEQSEISDSIMIFDFIHFPSIFCLSVKNKCYFAVKEM